MGNGQWIDCGIFLDQLMLLAREKGLHTCPQAAFSRYQHVVRRELGIPDDQVVICGLAMGYADPDAIPNNLITERANLHDVVALEAYEAGPATDKAIVVGAPARYVMDPAFDFGAQEGGIDLDADMRRQLQAQRDAMQSAISRLLAHLGAHTRNTVRGMQAMAAQPQ